jgi:hypothetical protein
MNRRGLIGVAALLGAGALGASAAGAPAPAYTVTCVVDGETTVTWRHEKLTQATLEWFAGNPTLPYVSTTVPIAPHPPRGFIVTSAGVVTGYVPTRVRVSFSHVGSSAVVDHVEAACA